jgi:hypothetical protein
VIREIGAVLSTLDEGKRDGFLSGLSTFNALSREASVPPGVISSSIDIFCYFVQDRHHATIRQQMEVLKGLSDGDRNGVLQSLRGPGPVLQGGEER